MHNVSIFVGTVYGSAQALADRLVTEIANAGYSAEIIDNPQVGDFIGADIPLFISSTTGQGDIPPNLEAFFHQLRDSFPLMEGKKFAVIGLGDSSYSTYCGAGHQIFELMIELQGTPATPLLQIDACETLEPETIGVPWVTTFIANL